MNSSDNQHINQYNVESIKLSEIAKLFAMVAISDGNITDREKKYMYHFFQTNYPDDISLKLCYEFDDYIKKNIDVDIPSDFAGEKVSYGEKIFFIMKIIELIFVDGAQEAELRTARTIANKLSIKKQDFDYIFSVYQGKPNKDLKKLSFVHITIGGDPEHYDVFLPYPELKMEAFKIGKFYCLIQKNDKNDIYINQFKAQKSSGVVKVPYESDILINDYLLDFEQFKLFFKNKFNRHPDKAYYINKESENYLLRSYRKENSILKLLLTGSLIRLTALKTTTKITVNDEDAGSDTFVNLSDYIEINGAHLSIRKVVYQELLEKDFIHIRPEKDIYILSNYGGDVYVSDKMEVKWDGKIIREEGKFYLDTGSCPFQFNVIRDQTISIIKHHISQSYYLNGQIADKNNNGKKRFELKHGDILYVKGGNIISCDFRNSVFEKTQFSFKTYAARNLTYYFNDQSKAIDDISFEADHGDLIGIMGPSGCGKSTLLNILNGNAISQRGEIFIDNFNFLSNYEKLINFLSYVPQDDLLFENLTVYENLYYNAKLRDPRNSKKNIDIQISKVLKDIGLTQKAHVKVGSPTDKVLSGGERKRLNIGLELLEDTNNIYFLDEPTSGLSSKDSEKVIDILKKLALKGNIIFTVIHQPSSKIYKKFNKIVLLDNGGKLAFFGDNQEAIRYFSGVSYYPTNRDTQIDPNIILDKLEEPMRDMDGTILPQRRFSPDYWKSKFNDYKENTTKIKIPTKNLIPIVPHKLTRYQGRFKQFLTLFTRNFKNKMRDKSNLVITFLEAPLLAVIISVILRYTPNGDYTLYNNLHFPTFIFLAVIVTVFLAMTNSADEIIKDSDIRHREKMLNISNTRYYVSKFLIMLIFAMIQNGLFILASFPILEIKELYFDYFIYLTVLSMTGISMGLLISSIPKLTSKAAQNIVPLILIPQIIFGGSLIKYRDMNKALTLAENSPIPEICQFMPSRWSYEGIMVMQAEKNSYHKGKDKLQAKLDSLVYYQYDYIKKMGERDYKALKDQILSEDIVEFRRKYKKGYGNLEINSAVVDGNEKFIDSFKDKLKENPELDSLTIEKDMVYPMFTKEKLVPFTEKKVKTYRFNLGILVVISATLSFLSLILLRFNHTFLTLLNNITKKFKKKN